MNPIRPDLSRLTTSLPSALDTAARLARSAQTNASGKATDAQRAGAAANSSVDVNGSDLRSIASRISDAERESFAALAKTDALEDITAQLAELRSLVAQVGGVSKSSESELSARQQRIDQLVQSITTAEQAAGLGAAASGGSIGQGGADPFDVSNIHARVEQYEISANLKPGESRDIDVVVAASAQLAGFYLSFGGNKLNLGGAGSTDGADDSFVFRLTGNQGQVELSFASGSSISDIAAAINAWSDSTGVQARVSGTRGIRLSSAEYGSEAFVSLQVVNDGGIAFAPNQGIYRLRLDDANAASRSQRLAFSSASNTQTDHGQDIAGLIEGGAAVGRGRELSRRIGDDLKVRITLEPGQSGIDEAAADVRGQLRAFTISRPEASPATATPSSLASLASGGELAQDKLASNGGAGRALELVDAIKTNAADRLDSEREARSAIGAEIARLTAQLRSATGAPEISGAQAAQLLRRALLSAPPPTQTPGGIEPKRPLDLLGG